MVIFRLTAVILLLQCLTPTWQAAAEPPPDSIIGARTDRDSAELWASQRSSAKRHAPSAQNVGKRAPRIVKTYIVACDGNSPDPATNLGTLCNRATVMCAATPEDDLGYWAYTAPAGTQDWTATGEYACRGPADPENPAAPEPVVTAEDFRRLPIPPAAVKVQPPNRRTLVNIPTNAYADASAVVLPTTVLGRAVRVRATPLRFRWAYGDGTTRATSDPGAPYPDLRTAHTYRTAGTVTLGLATVYTGEYSVEGGAWQAIDGTASVDSAAVALTVLAAENRLVAEPVP
jgi:hypothetical protein